MYYQDAKRKKIDTTASHGNSNSASKSFNLKTAHVASGLLSGKRKMSSQQASMNQLSETTEDQQYSASQLSSGYGSIFSSSSSSPPMKRQRSSTKKSDENFYNSFNFISPVKKPVVRKIFDPKKILKEKSSSENVIRCSTPVQSKANNKKALWGRFRSLHPEKLQTSAEFQPLKSIELKSFDNSLLTDESFNRTKLDENQSTENNREETEKTQDENKSTGSALSPIAELSPIVELKAFKRRNYRGREKVDIIRKLHEQQITLEPILKYLNFNDLLLLSEVSKEHRDIVRSIRTFETKRLNRIADYKRNAENSTPANVDTSRSSATGIIRKNKRKFGDFNDTNNETQKTSPPVSPSRRKFHENQKVAQSFKGKIKKCPLCNKPAKIQVLKIRKSPRKRKNLMKTISTGRVTKASNSSFQTSLKSKIETHIFYTTFPTFDKSPSTKSSCSNDSQSSISSDESSAFEDSNYESMSYEFAKCSYEQCSFKFCPNCNSKSHPRKECHELSLSPLRTRNENTSIACTSQSLKNLKRLKY